MKRILVIIATALTIILAGCAPSVSDNDIPDASLPDKPIGLTATPNDGRPVSPSQTGVYPAVINIGGLYAGARADDYADGSPLSVGIFNAEDTEATYTIYCQIPDIGRTRDGYIPAPYGVNQWVTFETTVTIPPHTWADVPFVIAIPKDTTDFIPLYWEFWMVACKSGQGVVEYANAIRVLVDMKD